MASTRLSTSRPRAIRHRLAPSAARVSHLAAARRRAREHEVGDVHARDQQDHAHRAEQQEHPRPHATDRGLVQRADGATVVLEPRGIAAASEAVIALMCASACSTVTPSARRPVTCRGALRDPSRVRWFSGTTYGTHTSVCRGPLTGDRKPRGITPMMVQVPAGTGNGAPYVSSAVDCSVRPITFGSAPNCRRHRPSLMSATRWLPSDSGALR